MTIYNGEETKFGADDGLRMCVKQWGDDAAHTRALCLHGWCDNAASFVPIAPYISTNGNDNGLPSVHMVAMDWAGHGHSSHRGRDATYTIAGRVMEVMNVARALGWVNDDASLPADGRKFVLFGHSMGAGYAAVFAAAFPELIERIVCVGTLCYSFTVVVENHCRHLHAMLVQQLVRCSFFCVVFFSFFFAVSECSCCVLLPATLERIRECMPLCVDDTNKTHMYVSNERSCNTI
jgi:pimeloyl-ACP methyl ester carboxylesterase